MHLVEVPRDTWVAYKGANNLIMIIILECIGYYKNDVLFSIINYLWILI